MSFETNTLELAPARRELPPGEIQVSDIVDADKNLEDRSNDGLTVILWLQRATNDGEKEYSTYITVEDAKNRKNGRPVVQRLDVPEGHNPLNKRNGRYHHPFQYL